MNHFSTTYREDFYDVIGCCSDWIDVSLTENLHQSCTISFQNPLGYSLKLALLCNGDPLLVLCIGQVHVHLHNHTDITTHAI